MALASQLLGIKAKVYMPLGAAMPKLAATRAYGAEVEQVGAILDESLVAAHEYADETGAVLVHPFDHLDIVAGQGTCGLEILDQCPDVGTVVVGLGGGGLLAGIAVGLPGDINFPLVRDLVDEVVTVSEASLSQAALFLLERAKLVVEPAGAAATAYLLSQGRDANLPGPVVSVISGGNIDPLLLMRIIRHGMAGAGRYLQVSVVVKDAPGSLAGVLATCAKAEANVLEVEHLRTSPDIRVDQVGLELILETRGPDHQQEVLDHLRAQGYDVRTPTSPA